MPGRLRPPTATAAEVVQDAQTAYIPGLQFNEALTWRAGKAIPVAELLTRLQTLAKELKKLEQDQVDRTAFTRVAQDLASANLLNHKDKGIRAYVASCVVDILRLCAPDAPFKNAQLKDIFTIIINSILPCLANPTDAYNTQHAYVLESLAEMKSIILLTDVDHPDTLILPLFTICFDIVSGTSKNAGGAELERAIEYNMTNLLVVVVDEVATLPQEVVDVVLSQFLRVDPRSAHHPATKSKKGAEDLDGKQGTLLLKDYPPAYNMAKAICTTCPEKMTSQISQYFNNVIVDASAPQETNGHAKHGGRRISHLDESDDEAEDVKELSKAHQLIRELWRACPDVLQNVIPQLEAELSAESVSLRLLATETIGDVAAGIGVSGPPPPAQLDPAAYPPASASFDGSGFSNLNRLLIPMSPKPFAGTHHSAYASFFSRRQDKSASVRAAWATAVGRILMTSAGGIGFDDGEDARLLSGLANSLGDADEKVRLAAITVIGTFGYSNFINTIGPNGGINKAGSVMTILGDRLKDRKHAVREQAFKVLGRLWGVASNDVQDGTDRIISVLGQVPTKIFEAYYTGDSDIQTLVDRTTFELLLPTSFPPIKPKASKAERSSQEDDATDPNTIRAQRVLTLIKGLDDRSRKIFLMMQARQIGVSRLVSNYLQSCEAYNGGVVDDEADAIKDTLTKWVNAISKTMAEPSRVSADLWKFAKIHDRRNYQLVKFAMRPENDYRTVINAIKELTKRIKEGPAGTVSLLETLTPLLYRCSLLVYNRSHVPTIMRLTRTDDFGLGETAYEVLKEISNRNPELLRTHVKDMCKELEDNAPTATNAEESSATDTLKACAAFSRKFPADLPKDRKFLLAMSSYTLHARSTKAAKHAVSLILTAADKKEMYAKDLLNKALEGCTYESPQFLTRLATLAQICLLAPAAANAQSDVIIRIAIKDTLKVNRNPSMQTEAYVWSDTGDEETEAKELALKVLVNRCRSMKDNSESFKELIDPLYVILIKLIDNEGEFSKGTPPSQKSRLRLAASRLLLKLCRHSRGCEDAVTQATFNQVALVALDRLSQVRNGFIEQIKKYLSRNRLHSRWLAVLFLLAFEPDSQLQSSTVTWLKARAQTYAQHSQGQPSAKSGHENVMELLFARLLSLLAHHPDFPDKNSQDYHVELVDYSRYICFYLSTIANEDNLSLIFHIAQRIKQTKDAISADDSNMSEHLYILSDLAQATIRDYADLLSHQKGHAANVNLLHTWPGKLRLPGQLFAALPDHATSQQIADKNFLPEEVAMELEKTVRAYVKATKQGHSQGSRHKRKSEAEDGEDEIPIKKHKKLPVRKPGATKTPKTVKRRNSEEMTPSEMPSRKSARTSTAAVSYADRDSDEDDAEMAEVEQAAAKRSVKRAQRKSSLSEAENAYGADVDDAEDDDEKENKQQETDEMDVEASDGQGSPSPLRSKTNGAAKKYSTASVKDKPNAANMAAKRKKVTPLKKNPEKDNLRETRRTRGAA